VTATDIRAYLRDARAFESIGGYEPNRYELSGTGEPSQVNAAELPALANALPWRSPCARVEAPAQPQTLQHIDVMPRNFEFLCFPVTSTGASSGCRCT
jgi:hypothetical protein